MLTGKGKHGFRRSGKGGKDIVKLSQSTSRAKDSTFAKGRPRDLDASEEKEGGILASLPMLKTSDNMRMLPRYTAILSRTEEDGIGMEDLDTLQLELEALLSCVAVRNRVIRDEIKVLESVEEKRDKKSKSMLASNLKRGGVRGEERPVKKLKESFKAEMNIPGKLSKFKGPADVDCLNSEKTIKPVASMALIREYPKILDVDCLDLKTIKPVAAVALIHVPAKDSPKPEAPKVVAHKNDTPNKFWASVEPYCAPITQDDLNYLEELIATRERDLDGEYMKIPPLGKHYSLKWTDEDLSDEVKKKPDVPERISGTAGPLTQRLVSALIEENVAPLQETNENKVNREISAHRVASMKNVQSLAFERRVRKELREQGLLDPEDTPKKLADDELLLEIKRVQAELKVVTQHNLNQLKHLHSLALAQFQRQEVKRKIKVLDTELLNLYALKQKKKVFTKKEKDQTWRLIREREYLLRQLYSINAV